MNRRYLIWPALCLLTWSVFWQTRQFEFLSIDDDAYITRNPHVATGLTAENMAWAFSMYAANWHPLTWLSLMLDAELWGLNAGAFHLTNAALHTLNALLLYAILRQWTGAVGRATFVAALFAVHPLHVESVAWISERKDTLSTLFGFLALLFYGQYARTSRRTWYAAAAAALVCSLLSKQMLVTFPFLVLLLDYWPLNRLSAPEGTARIAAWRCLVLEKAPLILIAILFCIIAAIAQERGKAVKSLETYSILVRIENAILSCALYLKNTVWPADLAMYYPHPGTAISLPAVIGATLLLAALTAVAVTQWKKQPWLGVGWFWFLGTLMPVIGLVQIGDQQMADRYTYIPLVGIFMAVAWGVPRVMEGDFAKRYVLPIAATAVVVMSAVLAWNQTRYWRDDVTLLDRTIAVTTDNAFARDNLGVVLFNKGSIAAAARQFEMAVQIQPKKSTAQFNLGRAYFMLNQPEKAAASLEQAVELQPADGLAHYYLGRIAKNAGDWNRAERHLYQSVRLRPDDADAHYHLGTVYQTQNKLPLAERQFQRSIALEPNVAGTYNNLGFVQMGLGKRDAAIASFKKSLELAPGWEPALENLRLATAPP